MTFAFDPNHFFLSTPFFSLTPTYSSVIYVVDRRHSLPQSVTAYITDAAEETRVAREWLEEKCARVLAGGNKPSSYDTLTEPARDYERESVALWARGGKEGSDAVYGGLAVKLSGQSASRLRPTEMCADTPDLSYFIFPALSNALADIVRDTMIIRDWRLLYLGKEHELTKQAHKWADSAAGLSRLVFRGRDFFEYDARGNMVEHREIRRYKDEPDLPDFELAPSWEAVTRTTPPDRGQGWHPRFGPYQGRPDAGWPAR